MTALGLRHAALVLSRARPAEVAGGGPRRVLVVSAHAGEGKTKVARDLVVELDLLGVNAGLRDVVDVAGGSAEEASEADSHRPAFLEIVDGPALLDEEEGAPMLTPARISALDGALLVVLGHQIRRSDIKASAERLAALGIPVIGVIWNGLEDPSAGLLRSDLERVWRVPHAALQRLWRVFRAPRAEAQDVR